MQSRCQRWKMLNTPHQCLKVLLELVGPRGTQLLPFCGLVLIT